MFRALQSGLTSSGEVRGYIGSQLSTRNALELKFIQDTNLGNINNYAQINLFGSDHSGIAIRKTQVDIGCSLDVSGRVASISTSNVQGFINATGGNTGLELRAIGGVAFIDLTNKAPAPGLDYDFRISRNIGTDVVLFDNAQNGGFLFQGGTVTIPSASIGTTTMSGNGQVLTINGVDHVYIRFQIGGVNRAYIGYGNPANTHFEIVNPIGNLSLFASLTTINSSLQTFGNIQAANNANDSFMVFTTGYGQFGTIECFNSTNTVKRPIHLNAYGGKVAVNTTTIGASATFQTNGRIRSTDTGDRKSVV